MTMVNITKAWKTSFGKSYLLTGHKWLWLVITIVRIRSLALNPLKMTSSKMNLADERKSERINFSTFRRQHHSRVEGSNLDLGDFSFSTFLPFFSFVRSYLDINMIVDNNFNKNSTRENTFVTSVLV